jgi:UDP-N-acetylmuramate dehydrogenase
LDEKIHRQVPLAAYTSWQIGGPAEFFFQPTDIAEVQAAVRWAQGQKQPLTILGGGSNVLVSDAGVAGLVLSLKKLTGFHVRPKAGSEVYCEALAGTSKSELLRFFLQEKLSPALFLAGLPGDVGGGVVMNAGVAEAFHPREFGELVRWVEVVRPDGELVRVADKALRWGYRHSSGWQPGVIVQVGLAWPDDKDDSILVQVREANRGRLTKQPLDLPSCGSVFRNPEGGKAAQLIDSCGLKGYTQGQAQVSKKHANFIVNLGGATAQDTWAVMREVKRKVFVKTGVQLQSEVVRLGRWTAEED